MKPPLSLLSTLLLLLYFDIAHGHAHNHHHDHSHTHTDPNTEANKHTLPPRTPKPSLPSCATLKKLNTTLTRISPVLEEVLSLEHGGSAGGPTHAALGHTNSHRLMHAHGDKNGTKEQGQGNRSTFRTRDGGIEGLAAAMERSKRRVAGGMVRCQGVEGVGNGGGNATATATAKSLERRRRLRKRGDEEESGSESDSSSSSSSSSGSDSDSDEDSDSDSEDEEDGKDEKSQGQCSLMDVLDNLVTSLECLLAFKGGALDGVLDLTYNMLGGIIDLVETSLY